MTELRSCAPIPWWIWAQLPTQMAVSLLVTYWLPRVAICFTLASLVELVWAAKRTLRRRAYVVRQRGMLQAEVVPQARRALERPARQVEPVRQRALPPGLR